ncbi:glycosyltransferase family 61 protein [Methylomonas sp. AM2-LC]|uniref:glycosyltransferase family 61 protein n=1 Tax=Methylomonas sp. AM2-LC TaxID=3153301 RepID=UPI0032642D4D
MIKLGYKILYKLIGSRFTPTKHFGCSRVLCAEETQTVKPAIFVSSHIERIKGSSQYAKLDYETSLIRKEIITHHPTVMYALGAAKIYSGMILAEKMQYLNLHNTHEDSVPYQDMNEAIISLSDYGAFFFGHWLRDDLSSALIGDLSRPFITLYKPKYQHLDGYSSLTDYQQIYVSRAKVKNLWLLTDFSQNSYKVERYLALRTRMQHKLNPVDIKYSGVYLCRGNTGTVRNLINEDEVINKLVSIGFDVLNPEQMTVEALFQRLWNAPLVVSVEGSAFNHALYPMALNGALLVLQPPYRFCNVHKGIAEAIGRRYGFYVCQSCENKTDFMVDDFDTLYRLIDQLSL